MIFTTRVHRFFFLFGLAVSISALPFSPFVLSVGLITLTINWLLDGAWNDKFYRLINRKSLWAFLLVYASIAIGFFYSDNAGYAIKELRLWLPILLVPIILATSNPIKKGELKFLLILFSTAVFVATIISLSIFIRDFSYLGQNVRYLSPFISHIRFALMVNLSIFLLFYLAFQKDYFQRKLVKLAIIFVALWFIAYLFILQSVTGIAILTLVSVLLLARWTITLREPVIKFSLIVALSFSVLLSFSYLAHTFDRFFARNSVDFKSLPKETVNGNPYIHDTLNRQFENGNLVWVNICYPELIRGWEQVSMIYAKDISRNYQEVEQTLIRYLTSKGLTKDSIGFSRLDSTDIRLINNNVSSVIYREHKVGLYPRLYQLLWELDNFKISGAASGSTLMQRVVYLNASWQIIRKNIFFGVGTGDGKDSLIDYYRTSNVNLDQNYWFISHNQYLTVWIASGLVGLIMFLVGLLFPFFYERKERCLPCLAFMVIVLLSMLSEDTFETHIGVSFAAIFYSILFFGYNFNQENVE
ncbi:MAG: hypothetical protein EHM93_07045 [Bacteroidales bacterium]|nr:MAG: hypothetical protein EHM93_07045 [Bacteroidales bacterium]